MTRFDVIEVEIKEPHRVRVIDRSKTEQVADKIVTMAVMRRGVEHHFYTAVAAGRYHDGDMWGKEGATL